MMVTTEVTMMVTMVVTIVLNCQGGWIGLDKWYDITSDTSSDVMSYETSDEG